MLQWYRWVQPYALGAVLAPWYIQLLRISWCLVVLALERGVFYWAASRCDLPQGPEVCLNNSQQSTFRVLVLSDPQIVENGTYGSISPIFQAVISHFSNNYLQKVWLALSKQGIGTWLWAQPRPADLVVFLGDMTDRGRWYQIFDFWSRSQESWRMLFPGISVLRSANQPITRRAPEDPYPALVLPGNHDIGLPLSNTGAPMLENKMAAEWFQQRYAPHVDDQFQLTDEHGALSWDARIPLSIGDSGNVTHELVLVNGPALVGMENIDAAPLRTEEALDEAKSRAASTSKMIDWLGEHANPDGVLP